MMEIIEKRYFKVGMLITEAFLNFALKSLVRVDVRESIYLFAILL